MALSGASSTSDHGISSYLWLLPPIRYDFTGQSIDISQWRVRQAVQNDKLILTGQNFWGSAYFFSVGTQVGRGSAMEARVDTSSTAGSYAMVGLRNLDFSSESYPNLVYAIYFADGGGSPKRANVLAHALAFRQ